jgi:hypothetical protein
LFANLDSSEDINVEYKAVGRIGAVAVIIINKDRISAIPELNSRICLPKDAEER